MEILDKNVHQIINLNLRGDRMRYLTAGESHGPQLTAILEGIPAGLFLTEEMVNEQLKRRQGGYGRGGRMKIESDRVQFLSGVRHGVTLGSPITLVIENKDHANWGEIMSVHPMANLTYEIKKVPRPGHADLVGAIKYGHQDLRNVLERSSARETAIRVAVGAICQILLAALEIEIFSHVIQIGEIKLDRYETSINKIKQKVECSTVRCQNETVANTMRMHIDEAKAAGDSLGGIVEVLAENVPAGLGSYVHYDRKLDAKLSAAMMSVQAVKGIFVGDAMASATKRGSQVHDQIAYDEGYYRLSNTYGGFEGGMTNGMPVVMQAFIKPIPTLYTPLDSVHLNTKTIEKSMIERSDCCIVPAAGVVLEAVMAIELAREILEQFHADQIEELQKQIIQYRDYVRSF